MDICSTFWVVSSIDSPLATSGAPTIVNIITAVMQIAEKRPFILYP
jgi:hypothetical protein